MSTTAPLPVTRGRRWILAAGVPLVLAAGVPVGWAWVHAAVKNLAVHDQVGRSVAVSVPVSGGQIRVTDSNGDLSFRTAAGSRIVVRGRLSGSYVHPALHYRATVTGLALDPTCPVQYGPCSAHLAVTGPAGLPVSVSTGFGTLRAAGLSGRIALTDTTGDLTVSRLTGDISLNDSFGELSATGLRGSRVELDNNSGDIRATGVAGDTRIRGSFGNVTVTGLSAANVTVSNDSGDVTLRFATVPRRVTVTDSFGNITLVLPPGTARYRVEARTTFGGRVVSVPQAPSAPNVITATNGNGDITISTATGSGH